VIKSKSNLMANFKVNRKRSRASEERMSTPRQQNIRRVYHNASVAASLPEPELDVNCIVDPGSCL
jgi:hypothetical protein